MRRKGVLLRRIRLMRRSCEVCTAVWRRVTFFFRPVRSQREDEGGKQREEE